jgi:hypothetical protein
VTLIQFHGLLPQEKSEDTKRIIQMAITIPDCPCIFSVFKFPFPVLWCPLRFPSINDVLFLFNFIRLIGKFMFDLCYLYLFTYTVVQTGLPYLNKFWSLIVFSFLLRSVYIMKRKLKQWCWQIPPISTKRIITFAYCIYIIRCYCTCFAGSIHVYLKHWISIVQ